MKVEDPEHSGLLPPSQVIEVSGLPGPVATTVPPQVLPDSTEVVGIVHGGVPPVGVPPVGVLPGVTEVVDIVPGEVPPVGGLPGSMQVGVNSGEVPPSDHVSGPIQVGAGHSEVPPSRWRTSWWSARTVSPRCEARWTRVRRSTKGKCEAPPCSLRPSPSCHIHR